MERRQDYRSSIRLREGMKKERVVVTGLGVTSCLGHDVDSFYEQLLQGKNGVTPISGFSCEGLQTQFAGEIKEFDAGTYIEKKQARRIDRCIAYAMVAGKKALFDAGVTGSVLEGLDKTKCGVIIGSGMGGMGVFVEGIQTLGNKGSKWVTPFFIPYILSNMPGALLAMDLGFMGPNYSISTACATGNYAIEAAANHIRRGESKLVICGGVEAPLLPMAIAGFNACRALSTRNEAPEKASRPWDKGRDGFVLGEGAGVLILESLEHALKRGAKIYAEYLGGAVSCDAHHMTEPRSDGKGVSLCIQKALAEAGTSPEEIDYINAHATSTPAGDMAEVHAIKQVFVRPEKIVMNGTKSLIGHPLGGAAAIEAVVTVKAIELGEVHPTLNLEDPEPNLDFNIPTKRLKIPIRKAISNSFGFGGHNSTVVFGKYGI